MSRSKKKTKGPGHEYWGKRAISRNGGAVPGKVTKKLTHSKERAENKQKLLKEPHEPEYDDREYVAREDCDDS